MKAFISKIKEFAAREQRDTDFEEWCDDIGINVIKSTSSQPEVILMLFLRLFYVI